ncbi:MAG TPA: carboxylating nicotinate-nucleotide diphosphorylase [Planctomycetaceae bacterium]|nr:carboxylating nicotinate-nucleotide diphosphorylase [Planctomycetaceae bacterium]
MLPLGPDPVWLDPPRLETAFCPCQNSTSVDGASTRAPHYSVANPESQVLNPPIGTRIVFSYLPVTIYDTLPNANTTMAIEFNSDCEASARVLTRMSLDEDLRDVGDLTSLSTIPSDLIATVNIVSRQAGVLSGLAILPIVFSEMDVPVQVTTHANDGDPVAPQTLIASVTGPAQTLLTAERTILNFMTLLSGIASRTAQLVTEVRHTKAVILDTRKTFPGYRLLQKYAVRCGGGTNHRMGLYDGILIKDNHIAARGDASCAAAVADARQYAISHGVNPHIEIEVDSLEQLRDALNEHPEIVLLDNMDPITMSEAVRLRDVSTSPATLLEASGGVTLQTVGAIAESGVDRISIGSLTHSSPALDIGFDWPW